jgi:hypothetical protein
VFYVSNYLKVLKLPDIRTYEAFLCRCFAELGNAREKIKGCIALKQAQMCPSVLFNSQ